MASWRDGVPESVQNDFETAAAILEEQGGEWLAKNGEVAPFGLVIEGDDPPTEYYPVTAEPGEGVAPDADEAIAILIEGCREGRDRWRVAGIAYDVLVEEEQDALCMDLEHRDGYALRVLAAYTGTGGELSFADPESAYLEPRIWA